MSQKLPYAVKCNFPPGECNMLTRDPSTLCHHHRRFSQVIYNDDGSTMKGNRLSASLELAQSNPDEFQRVLAQATEAMDRRPRAYAIPDHAPNAILLTGQLPDRVWWRGEQYPIPFTHSVAVEIVHNADRVGELIAYIKDDADNEAVIAELNRSNEAMYSNETAAQFGLYDGAAEEYDDVSEAMAQLELGRRIAGARVSVMNSDDDQTTHLRIHRGDSGPEAVVTLTRNDASIDERGELLPQYESSSVQTLNDEPLTPQQRNLVHAMAHLRTVIHTYGAKNSANGKLYLPVGWTDR